MIITPELVSRHAVEWAPREIDLIPLGLFLGGKTLGRIRADWSYFLAMKDAEIMTFSDMVKIQPLLPENPKHLAGIHAKVLQHSQLQGFFSRVFYTPEVWNLTSGVEEYVKSVFDASPWRVQPWMLTRISRFAYRTHRDWRKEDRPVPLWVDRQKVVLSYPYIKPSDDSGEHRLTLLAHKLIPHGLPNGLREDLCQDLIVDLLTGELTEENLKGSIHGFVKKALRKYPSKYEGLSMETSLFDGHKTLGQMISSEGTVYA
jgi:hypothetical protein